MKAVLSWNFGKITFGKITYVTMGILFAGITTAQYTPIILNPPGYSSAALLASSGSAFTGSGTSTGDSQHAMLWIGEGTSYVDLNPTNGITTSAAVGISGATQVGYGYGSATGGKSHALLWNGSADSYVDLNPTGYTSSEARATLGSKQVGFGSIGNNNHAIMWSGSSGSFVDLNPQGHANSQLSGMSETTQFGVCDSRAAIWTGSANSYVDYHPSNTYSLSFISGMYGSTLVGSGFIGFAGQRHALLWQGSANNYTDLHDAVYSSTWANGVYGLTQVGAGSISGRTHALRWAGTSASLIDLHSMLSTLPISMVSSQAIGTLSNGDIFGYSSDQSGQSYAVIWKVNSVPEPSTLLVLVCLGTGFLFRKRRQGEVLP